jgi:hypothetical protein
MIDTDTMKRNLTVILVSLGLAGAMFGGFELAYAQSATAPQEAHRANERHPKIHQAIAALEAAKVDMQRADHDFGGHRKAALEECDKAIGQLRLALQYDKK